jgi:hypothetical protein
VRHICRDVVVCGLVVYVPRKTVNIGTSHLLTHHTTALPFFAISPTTARRNIRRSPTISQLSSWASQQQWPFRTAPRPSLSQCGCGRSPSERQHSLQNRTTHHFSSAMALWLEYLPRNSHRRVFAPSSRLWTTNACTFMNSLGRKRTANIETECSTLPKITLCRNSPSLFYRKGKG